MNKAGVVGVRCGYPRPKNIGKHKKGGHAGGGSSDVSSPALKKEVMLSSKSNPICDVNGSRVAEDGRRIDWTSRESQIQ